MGEALSSDPDDKLCRYRKRRDPAATTEPFEADAPKRGGPTRRGHFVVHCHSARTLHYDLRLQVGSVLQSFAIPKGPSLRADDKRLAVQTEPHPLRYLDFEGVIPEGSYGAGAMIVWDRGLVSYPKAPAEQGLRQGALSFELDGFKLKGRFSLVRTAKSARAGSPEWLLIKRQDAFAQDEEDIVHSRPRSVLSGLTVQERANAKALYRALLEEVAHSGAPKAHLAASRMTPMLCTSADAPLQRSDWIYELKLDGVRILAERHDGDARLFYRTHRTATANFPEVVDALRTLLAEDVLLDGEIVSFDSRGRPSFQKLGRRVQARRASELRLLRDAIPVRFVVFDILSLGEYDLRALPLRQRKKILSQVLPDGGLIRPLEYLLEDGTPLQSFCEAHELEGLVSKRADSPYRSGPVRTGDWIKLKRVREDDFIVIGYRPGKGSRQRLGALGLGSYQDGAIRPCGQVGSGLSNADTDALLQRLLPLARRTTPGRAADQEPGDELVRVEPRIVVRVRYGGWTDEGRLRHPVYLGIREDLNLEEAVVVPKPEDATMLDEGELQRSNDRVVGKARLTNQDKVFWPDDGITKGRLCEYYETVAATLLPHIENRPVSLVRYPDGIDGKSFFQWRIPAKAPTWLKSLQLRTGEDDGKEISTILVNDLSSLMYVVNLGCIPLHVIASRAGSLDTCDFLTLDLDVAQASLAQAIPIAISIREVLEELGLLGFPKTSGKTGMHVLVPLGEGMPFDAAKQLLELIARLVLRRHPEAATMERRKDKRGPRVFIDVGQTGRLRTIVAPYSVRAIPGATVSTPLHWDEVSLSLDPRAFDIFTVPERLLSVGDPMADAWKTQVDLEQTMASLQRLVHSGGGA